MKHQIEPFWWSLFGAGGAISALLLPVLLFIFALGIPLSWIEQPSFDQVYEIAKNPITRIVLFGVISLSLMHWAHRFRFTLYEGLQLHRYGFIIALFCYGSAIIITIITGYALWSF